jgi:PAS domain-containing protein
MSGSVPRPRKRPALGKRALQASGDGFWELNLWDGSARFSDWFYQRLQWPTDFKRKTLLDLQPNLPSGAWEALLLAIRGHLEQQLPLDAELCVQLSSGRIEWWHILGSAQRNAAGRPVHLTGSMRDVTAERCPGASDVQP